MRSMFIAPPPPSAPRTPTAPGGGSVSSDGRREGMGGRRRVRRDLLRQPDRRPEASETPSEADGLAFLLLPHRVEDADTEMPERECKASGMDRKEHPRVLMPLARPAPFVHESRRVVHGDR